MNQSNKKENKLSQMGEEGIGTFPMDLICFK
jgi:hypothetical protein